MLAVVAGAGHHADPGTGGRAIDRRRLGQAFSGWQQLATAAEHGHADLAGLDPWARRHLDRLVALEQTWPQAAAGRTLLHLTCGPATCCSPRPG